MILHPCPCGHESCEQIRQLLERLTDAIGAEPIPIDLAFVALGILARGMVDGAAEDDMTFQQCSALFAEGFGATIVPLANLENEELH